MSTLYDYLLTHPYGGTEVIPTPPDSSVVFRYRPDLVSLRDNLPSLAGVATVGWGLGSRLDTFINSIARSWFLEAGSADPDDLIGQVAPDDYDADTNDVHWQSG
jgi:hypothetical protein